MSYNPGQFSRSNEPRKEFGASTTDGSRATVPAEDIPYNTRREGDRSFSPPSSKEDAIVVTNGYNKASSVSSEEGKICF